MVCSSLEITPDGEEYLHLPLLLSHSFALSQDAFILNQLMKTTISSAIITELKMIPGKDSMKFKIMKQKYHALTLFLILRICSSSN
ncbi:MAG: hypothetical protein DRJ13_11815 [Bacteroidetes bacterium]|nr:MAG: hypothetical protein DRJ13_11815 [Bacteroidota bacterium]